MPKTLNSHHEAEARAEQAQTRETECRKQLEQALGIVQQALVLAHEAETRAARAEARAEETQTRNSELEASLRSTQQELHDVQQSNHHHLQLAEARQQHLQALLSSYSWRITWPLRKAVELLYLLTVIPVRFFKAMLIRPMKFVLARPTLALKLDARISRFPNLRRWLLNMAANAGLVAPVAPMFNASDLARTTIKAPGLEHLTPRARRIYTDLKAAIEQHSKETG